MVTVPMTAPISEHPNDPRMVALNVVSIRSEPDVIAARMAARDIARKMGFNAIDQARIATTASELARNIFIYAGEGTVTINQVQRNELYGIELMFEDQGPGIPDTTHPTSAAPVHGDTPGIGLLASRRLMDEMEITTSAGVGTRIICRKWRR